MGIMDIMMVLWGYWLFQKFVWVQWKFFLYFIKKNAITVSSFVPPSCPKNKQKISEIDQISEFSFGNYMIRPLISSNEIKITKLGG